MTRKENGYKDCNKQKKFITNTDFLKSKDSTAYALWLQLHRKILKNMYLIYLYFSTVQYSNLLN